MHDYIFTCSIATPEPMQEGQPSFVLIFVCALMVFAYDVLHVDILHGVNTKHLNDVFVINRGKFVSKAGSEQFI